MTGREQQTDAVRAAEHRLSDVEREVLSELHGNRDYDPKGFGAGWLRPMDIGGRDGSRHSSILRKLVRFDFVETQRRDFGHGSRGSRLYRITEAGRAALAEHQGDD